MPQRSFKALVIAASGTFAGYKHSDIKTLAEGEGAEFNFSVTDRCTHLITIQKDIDKKTTKYQAAIKFSSHVVSLEWLLKSVEAKKPLPEKTFLLDSDQIDTNPKVKIESNNGKDVTEKPGTKRSATPDEAEAAESNKIQKDAQKSSFKSLIVPVDEAFLMENGNYGAYAVYIDEAGLIWDATLNQTVSAKNNNKFYRIQLLKSNSGSFVTWTRWGRVGECGQSACLGHDLKTSIGWFERKFKDKSGLKWENRLDNPKPGKYTFIERNYEEDDEEEESVKQEPSEEKPGAESTLSKPIQNLMKFIFNPEHFQNAMASMSYDAQKLPLGKLSERTLKRGFSLLKELAELISAPDLADSRYDMGYAPAMEHLSNQYYTVIPHDFGRNRPPVLSSDAQLKKEIELLEALTDMDVANEIMKDSKESDVNELDRQFQSLGMEEMTCLDKKGSEFSELASYLLNSRGSTHDIRYEIINIFRIERRDENERFESSKFAKINNSNRRLLWHGSRSTNFGGILKAPVNGYMFGKGVYLADTSTKSANYCCPRNSGNMGLLLLCEAELGSPMLELSDSDYMAGENAKKAGKLATLGKGRSIPGGWKDGDCLSSTLAGVKMPDMSAARATDDSVWLQYNEYIVYDVAQIRQRYLFYVHMH
ncbi:hypothetical protein N7512_002328 [Penicillium capsulatum]|nr:hypothetical protein N7512_002328 [Penicillium capsulatum]